MIHTVAYNGSVPGPLIRWPEGKPITIDVVNHTDMPEIVHWHGLWIPSDEDGAMEEGSPMIAPGGQRRYSFTPRPAGFRWYHTHTFAGHDLKRGAYTGQFGCFYIEPKQGARCVRSGDIPHTARLECVYGGRRRRVHGCVL